MNKISPRLEDIFAHAVALQQSGRFRSNIYCIGSKVYILNQDHTVLMRFRLRKTDKLNFEQPVSFAANDYNSRMVEERDGHICFIREENGWEQTKSSKVPSMAPAEVEQLFKSYPQDKGNTITLHSGILGLLDESLSHVEFSCDSDGFKIIQRNIYSGSVSELKKKKSGGFLQDSSNMEEFSPIGLRTNDFMAMFAFIDTLRFHFINGGVIVVDSAEKTMPMRALISKCRYDELGGIENHTDEEEIPF